MGGIADDVILKALGGVGAFGGLVWLIIVMGRALLSYFEKQATVAAEKDKLFAQSLERFGADVKSAMGEVRGAVDTLRSAMVDMDRGHTEYARQNYIQLIAIIDKQNGANTLVVTKVEHLDETTKELSGRVERLNDTIEDHGVKLDALARAVPGGAGFRQIGGKTGVAGATGAAGAAGAMGATGLTGAMGATGLMGATGIAGPMGPPGPPGSPG